MFQKSTTVKRPQQTISESPSCDTSAAMVNEVGEIELPHSHPHPHPHDFSMGLQNYININSSSTGESDDHNTMMMNGWNINNIAAGTEAPPNSSTWPFLTSNLSINSLLLTALHLRPLTDHHNYSFIPQGNINASAGFTSDFNMQLHPSTSDATLPPSPPYNVNW